MRAVRVRDLIDRSARRLSRAGVFFGHGTANARDDAAALVLHALSLPRDAGPAIYSRRVSGELRRRAEDLVSRRIDERIPAVYLTGVTWFAGLSFHVDPRVLIPRSPLAELIERQFAPWIEAARVRRILDVGTGSGCIAIACAKVFPRAHVDAVELSSAALEVASINVRGHRLGRRVRLIESDHFRALAGRGRIFRARGKKAGPSGAGPSGAGPSRAGAPGVGPSQASRAEPSRAAGRAPQTQNLQTYDIIVANPPYVGARELKSLPPEYRHEPRMALSAGPAGLDSVKVILSEAGRRLAPRGILVVEVGNTETAVRRAYRDLPFTWLEFERGGGGVFLLTAEQLRTHDQAHVR